MKSWDLDGVVTRGCKPEPNDIIVSGRLSTYWDQTIHQVYNELGVHTSVAIYLRPFGDPADRAAAAYWKALVINAAGVTHHFDDDPVQEELLVAMTRCQIVHVKSDEELQAGSDSAPQQGQAAGNSSLDAKSQAQAPVSPGASQPGQAPASGTPAPTKPMREPPPSKAALTFPQPGDAPVIPQVVEPERPAGLLPPPGGAQ